MNSYKPWVVVMIVLACSFVGFAQTVPDLDQGMNPYGSYHGGNLDTVSLNNGNLFFHAALLSYPQRGSELAYPLELIYNNKNFTLYKDACLPAPSKSCRYSVVFGPPPTNSGSGVSQGATVTVGFAGLPRVISTPSIGINTGLSNEGNPIYVHTYSVLMPDGSHRPLVNTGSVWMSQDGSGYRYDPVSNILIDDHGTRYNNSLATPVAEDASGNRLGVGSSATTDTLGRLIPASPVPATASTASLTACPTLNYSFQPVTFAYTWNLPAPASGGGSITLVLCYASVYVRTAMFGSSPVDPGGTGQGFHDLAKSFTMLQSVVYPDNTYWAFQYDAADPNNPASVSFGDLQKITLPTGGSLTYTYTTSAGCSDANSGTGPLSRSVLTRTVDANDGTGPHQWTYGTAVTDPLGNDTVHTFTYLNGTCSAYETQTQYYQGSHTGGTLLKTISTDYSFTANPYDDDIVTGLSTPNTVANVYPVRVTTTLSNGLVSKVEVDYDTALVYHGPLDGITWNIKTCPPTDPGGFENDDCHYYFWGDQTTNPVTNYTGSYGKVVAKREYDWGQGAPGPLLRQTTYTYQWQNGTNAASYLSNNFLDLPSSVTVYDGTINQIAKTTYAYDETALAGSSVSTQHDSNPVNESIRGNQTTISHWLNTNNSMLSSHTTYFDTGELQSSTDPLGHTTTHLYDAAYVGAFSTQTCSPATGGGTVTHCVSGTYDFNTGLLTSLTNENATQQASGNSPGDSAHTSTYGHDQYWRLTSAQGPPDSANNGQPDTTSFTYSVSPLIVTRQKSVTAGLSDTAKAYFDGVGRTFETTHALPNGTATVITTFDADGQTSSVTNPYFSTSDPTYGVTQSHYDALGRVTQTIKQDGSVSQVKYNVSNTLGLTADCTTTIDEAGKQRGVCTDALGRLVEVDEPYASGLLINNYATLQSGGNFALLNSANSSLWSTGTSGTNAQSIFMQDDGNLVLYIFKWSAGTYAAPTPGSYPQAACSIGTYLVAGQTLPSGSCIASPHWQYFLYMAPDGNLYIYNWATGAGTWGPGTQGHPGAYARLETNGNFVVYTSTGTVLWSSGTSGTNAERLDMEDDGRIILYKSAWNSGTSTGQFNWSQLAHPGCDAGIGTGTTGMLGAGQCFVSPNGHFELLLQNDGNLVIYDLGASPANALWSTNTGISPVDPGYAMRTLYKYDALGNLYCVEQHGTAASGTACPASPPSASTPVAPDPANAWRRRMFAYDSLSRLLWASNPESGIISYVYDNDGNLLQKTSPAPNQIGSATQTVSYCYDEQHRITGKGYGAQSCPLSAPAVTYAYDSSINAKGKLTSITDQAGTATYGYDVLGRMTTETRPIAGVTKSIAYGYNLDGSLKTLTYPSGRVVTYGVDTAGQITTVTDGNGTQYVTNATYYASGAEYQRFMPGIYFRNDLNPRLQVSGFYSNNGQTTTFVNKTYSYGVAHQNNGNIVSITNNNDGNRSQTFTYDLLNRITAGWSSANNGNYSWGENYSIDAWGNLQISQMSGKANGGNFTLSATAQNQPTGMGYDAAGNLLSYLSATYTYDPENRLASTSGMSYTYDGNGERVLKSQTVGGAAVKRYWSMGGNTLTEADGSGNLTAEYIYVRGKRVARIDLPSGSVHYYLSDHLNSTSMVVSATGAIEEESDYSSFGTEYVITGAGINRYKFTNKERDTETNCDYFGARYYCNMLGRFISADWSSSPTPVPYATINDPQSLNLYGYVRNNPIWRPDIDGHGFWTKLKNKMTGGGWNEDAEANQERARRLHTRAMEAKKNISGATGVLIHGEPPQMFVQGATDQQLIDGQRELVEYLASKVKFPVQCDEGVSCGVVIPVGIPEPIEEGPSTQYENTTAPSALVTNIRTGITPAEFGANLEANGFVKSTASDGTALYTKGAKEYAVYPKATSTGGATAQVSINGQVVGKIRLK